MDIGTAKPKGKWQGKGEKRAYYVNNLPHYLMDFLDPGEIFTAAEFRDSALNIIQTTEQNRLIPFVVGGTGLYISALADIGLFLECRRIKNSGKVWKKKPMMN